ncbi:hypothetical protein IAE60_13300 [Pseudoxanthomonas mexicana]|jgi:hypothetical protein|uniref:Transmembrane protein n=1 Tax=Pseudoxanthomonas mexicana TaxID=128785 RepID=A0A7G9T9Y4_PSEMX|nr:hypothetical protein [Pseudoxanthomonas mexicana]QNN76909.1 hypothetical protein IAE60_13300 [Pseudoxanthomonas mexicana]
MLDTIQQTHTVQGAQDAMNARDNEEQVDPPTRRLRYADRDKTVFEEFAEHLDAEILVKDEDQTGQPPANARGIKDQSDAYVREVVLIRHMSHAELVARIQALRQNLREMMSPPDYDDLMRQLAAVSSAQAAQVANAPQPPLDGQPVSPLDPLQYLREEAKALLDRAYRRYVLLPKVEQQRSAISGRMLRWVGGAAFGLWALLFLYRYTGMAWLGTVSIAYLTAAIAGSVGATVSTLMRLQKLDTRREPLMLWMSLQEGAISLWLSPILGALFGLLFLLLMRSGLVSGTLFPDFELEHWQRGGLHLDLNQCPGNEACGGLYRDYTWLIMWTFAAGWAERLVPDVLNRLTSQTLTYVRDGGAK